MTTANARRWLVDGRGYRDIWLVITTGLAAWAILLTFQVSDNNRESLCTLRADLERRVAASTKFLQEHPDGIPGIEPREIRDGIDNQQRTISSLRGLNCPKRK